jgi:hypothetical protein
MRIYLAAAYARQAEMQGVRDALTELGHEITSRWIDRTTEPPGGMGAVELFTDPAAGIGHAREDLADIDAAEAVISFTGSGTRGGRHTDFGYALGKGKYLVLAGTREHIFHSLVDEWYPDFSTLMREFRLGGRARQLAQPEDARDIAARLGVSQQPWFDPACDACNKDWHRCPGCGTPVAHGQATCRQCARL